MDNKYRFCEYCGGILNPTIINKQKIYVCLNNTCDFYNSRYSNFEIRFARTENGEHYKFRDVSGSPNKPPNLS